MYSFLFLFTASWGNNIHDKKTTNCHNLPNPGEESSTNLLFSKSSSEWFRNVFIDKQVVFQRIV